VAGLAIPLQIKYNAYNGQKDFQNAGQKHSTIAEPKLVCLLVT